MTLNDTQKKWLDALKSGEYKQTTGNMILKKDSIERYCALGVLCKVLELEEKEDTSGQGFASKDTTDPLIYKKGPPPLARRLVNMDYKLQALIFYWNDVEKLDFKNIANRIEHYFKVN